MSDAPTEIKKGEYYVFQKTDDAEVAGFIRSLIDTGEIAFDIETTGLDPRAGEIIGFSLSHREYTGVYIPLVEIDNHILETTKSYWPESVEREILTATKELLTSPVRKFIQKFDFELSWVLVHWGFEISDPVFDTMVAAYVANPERKSASLLALSQQWPDLKSMKDIWDKIKSKKDKNLLHHYTTNQIGEYGAKDSDATIRVGHVLRAGTRGKPYEHLIDVRMGQITRLTSRMTHHGILVDREYLVSKRKEILAKEMAAFEKIRDESGIPGFNPGSSTDLGKLFFGKLGVPQIRGTHLDEPVMNELANKHNIPMAKLVVEYRKLKVLRSTYFDGLEKCINPLDGCIHEEFNHLGTRTGRLASRLHGIPADDDTVSRMLIPRPGNVFIGADYSQIELRLIAWLSGDERLLSAYNNGEDVHRITALDAFGISFDAVTPFQRSVGKTINFGLMYGGGPMVLVRQLGNKLMGENVPETEVFDKNLLLKKAKIFREAFFDLYPGIPRWVQRVIKQARYDGYVVSAYGRVRLLPDINSDDEKDKSHAERQALNTNPQGTASDYCLFRFDDVLNEARRRGLYAEPCIARHDAQYYEVKEDEAEEVSKIVEVVGVRTDDEAKIGVKMILEPNIGRHMGEV